MSDARKAEKMLRNLARRLERDAPGVSRSILEGIDEILTVTRPGLPPELRKSPGSTNIIESMNSVVRQASRNVKRRRDASMALRRPSSGMLEAQKGFRRINACRQLPLLEQALARHRGKLPVDAMEDAAQGSSRIPAPGNFNTDRDIPPQLNWFAKMRAQEGFHTGTRYERPDAVRNTTGGCCETLR